MFNTKQNTAKTIDALLLMTIFLTIITVFLSWKTVSENINTFLIYHLLPQVIFSVFIYTKKSRIASAIFIFDFFAKIVGMAGRGGNSILLKTLYHY